ncbi:MAG TPA: benzoylformate decarboxylase [Streptosporangiaceae bacterium]|jgi:benzoylformate decarboxylase
MRSVRDVVFSFFRARGMTTMFGNPGSTELPFLADFPDDFTYVLGLHEGAAVAMADAYAQVTGRAAVVNLHTAPGVGNAVGALVNAQANRAPLVVTAGQQVRAMMQFEALLTNTGAVELPRPAVKWSYEPPRPQDVPAALARATHLAMAPPRGPVFVSLPMDDLTAPADDAATDLVVARTVTGRAAPDPDAVADLARRLAGAANPVLVLGGGVDASGGLGAAVELAERLRVPVWRAPEPGRIGFPEDHPYFRGSLPNAIAPLSKRLAGHDLVVVVGAAVFKYYPYVPGDFLPPGAALVQVTDDVEEAARAPMGDAVVADPALTLRRLVELVPASDREPPAGRSAPRPVSYDDGPLTAEAVFATVAAALPDDAVIFNESPSNLAAHRDQIRPGRPASFFFTASGGLGFALPGAVGAAMARPERPVLAVVGDGSAQYAITALWTAARYHVPVTVLVLVNAEYKILKWFGQREDVKDVPGLDLGGIDHVALATGYGVPAVHAATAEGVRAALENAFATDGPHLIEVPIA